METLARNALGQIIADKIILLLSYSQPFEEMVLASQNHYVSQRVTEKNFPISGKGILKCEFSLFSFEEGISSEEIIKQIKITDMGKPWEPARIEHLLCFAENFPGEPVRGKIMALGSVGEFCPGSYRAPCLVRDTENLGQRMLSTIYWGHRWRKNNYFLAVREISRRMVA